MHPQQVLINRIKAVNMQKCQTPVHAEQGSTCKPALGERTSMEAPIEDRKSTRLNSSHGYISYAVFCLKKKKKHKALKHSRESDITYSHASSTYRSYDATQ